MEMVSWLHSRRDSLQLYSGGHDQGDQAMPSEVAVKAFSATTALQMFPAELQPASKILVSYMISYVWSNGCALTLVHFDIVS